MAPGVLSSGSTLMPPVQRTRSTPLFRTPAMAAAMASSSSPARRCSVTAMPNSSSFRRTTGVKASWTSPLATSLPVVMTPAVFSFQGRSSSRGASPAASSARESFSSSITRGITRVPQSLSPARTGVLPRRVAIMTSSSRFTAFSRRVSTRKRPSMAAVSSILPSLTALRTMCSFSQSRTSRPAASFSWTMPGTISQT